MCKVYVVSTVYSRPDDTGIKAMNELLRFFNRRTPGFAKECDTLVDLWNSCFNTTHISMQKMPLPDFQEILKGVVGPGSF